jgi:hypothetical protein
MIGNTFSAFLSAIAWMDACAALRASGSLGPPSRTPLAFARQGLSGSRGNHFTLALRHRREKVDHEGISIRPEFRNDKSYALGDQS